MDSQPHTFPASLLGLAESVGAATAHWNTEVELAPLTGFLARVRRALGMEVAFISRFRQGTRVFEAVSASPAHGEAIHVGDIDELDETYCQLILDGVVSPIIKDAAAEPRLVALPITERLRIRSYLSATIVLRSGYVYGTLCCYSSAARSDLQAIDSAALQAVADAIAADIDRHGQLTRHIWQWG